MIHAALSSISSVARPRPRPVAAQGHRLRDFHDRHAGEAIVVCGCGTSLNELEEPQRFTTIGVNDVGRKFDPDYLVVVNPRRQFSAERFHYVEASGARALFTQLELGAVQPPVVPFRLGQLSGTDLEQMLARDVLHYTQNSPYVAVCLALYMGARRIGLIGVDFSEDHFFARSGRHPLAGRLEQIDREYGALHQACQRRGIEFFNLGTGSRLQSLPRLTLRQFGEATAVAAVPVPAPAPPTRVFVVNHHFIACGDVFSDGLRHAAAELGCAHAEAFWDDQALPAKVAAFQPDLLLVIDGRRFIHKWGQHFDRYRTAVWLVNEPYEVDDTARWSPRFGTVFLNDPASLNRHANAHELPVCFDPQVHRDSGRERIHLAGFIGAPSPTRERFLEPLAAQGLLDYLIGGPWITPALQRLCRAHSLPSRQTAELYQRTRIVINVFRDRHHFNALHVPARSMNPRIYEALACGALVVSEWRPEVAEVFPDLPTFEDPASLARILQELAVDPDQVAQRLHASRARLPGHDYAARLRQVIALSRTPGTVEPAPYRPLPQATALPQSLLVPAPATPSPVELPGWRRVGDAATRFADGLLHLGATTSGQEAGYASLEGHQQGRLRAMLCLSDRCGFLARLGDAGGGAGAVDLVSRGTTATGTYLARGQRLLRHVPLPRLRWFLMELACQDGEIRLSIDGREVARCQDAPPAGGPAFLGLRDGHLELRDLRFEALPGPDRPPTQRPMQARDPAAPVPAPGLPAEPRRRLVPVAYQGHPRRNLIFHVWPVRGSVWRWNIERLLRHIDLFNGRRIIAIVHDDRSEPPAAVRALFDGHGCEFIELPNQPCGESLSFPLLLERVASRDPDEVTFYGHAKGVRHGDAVSASIRTWTEALYDTLLLDWPSVHAQLEHCAMVGSFRMLGRFRAHQNLGDWHYSGTFFWLRHALAFQRDIRHVPAVYCGVELWPGLHFTREETGCLLFDNLDQLLYNDAFWRRSGHAELRRWHAARRPPAPPPDLVAPRPVDGYAEPRLEQIPEEFEWFLRQLLAAAPRSILTIGSTHGGLEWHLARRLRERGLDAMITAVDAAGREELLRNVEDARARWSQPIDVLVGDPRTDAVRSRLAPRYDAVFLDGDRGYRGVRQDYDLALSLGARLIALHDIVDSAWHAQVGCCVSRLWSEIEAAGDTEALRLGSWGGIGIVRPQGVAGSERGVRQAAAA